MILSFIDVHLKIKSTLCKFQKIFSVWQLKKRELFSSIPAPLWALSSVLASLPHSETPLLPPIYLQYLAFSSSVAFSYLSALEGKKLFLCRSFLALPWSAQPIQVTVSIKPQKQGFGDIFAVSLSIYAHQFGPGN